MGFNFRNYFIVFSTKVIIIEDVKLMDLLSSGTQDGCCCVKLRRDYLDNFFAQKKLSE